jgi:sugar/nucleoside kinase (ribokinase family)
MADKKNDVIVVGELNVDLILNKIQGFPEKGKEKLAQEMTLTLGSSAAIFASNLNALGAKTAFLGKIGNDIFANLVINSLEKRGVNTEYVIRDGQLKTGATIVLNYEDERAAVTYPGAMDYLVIGDITSEKLKSARHLHFSSYYMQPGIKKDVAAMFRMAKEAGLTTSLDMQWDPQEKWDLDIKNIMPYVDIFLPNRQEIMQLTKQVNMGEAVKIIGNDTIVAIKMAEKGSQVWYNGRKLELPAFKNDNVIDPVGAGDSFNAGFILKYISGAPLEECQKFGNLCGAVNTTAAGGTTAFTSYEDVMKIAYEKFGVAL